MPDRNWPPLQRRIARVLRAGVYAFAAAAGTLITLFPPDPVIDALGHGWAEGIGGLAGLSGLLALVAVLAHNWHLEWVGAWGAAAAFAGYTVIDWGFVAAGDYHRAAEASALTVATLLLLARCVDLWVFSMTVVALREARVKSWRRVAGQER